MIERTHAQSTVGAAGPVVADRQQPARAASFARAGRTCACLAAGLGGLVLVGWVLHIKAFERVSPELVAMKANTALCLIALGLASGLRLDQTRPAQSRWIKRLLFATGLLVALITLAEYAFSFELIDQWLFKDPDTRLMPGRMSPATAIGLALFALAALQRDASRSRVLDRMTDAAVLVVSIAMLVTIIGYAYGADELYTIAGYPTIAVHTAVGLLLLCVGLLLSQPGRGLMAHVVDATAGGLLLRRILPLAILAPPLIGFLCLQGQHAGFYDFEIGLSLFAVANVVCFACFIVWTAGALREIEDARGRAERESAKLAREIEERKAVELALVGMTDRFLRAAAAGRVGVWVWDVQSDALTWDDTMLSLYGLTRESFPGAYIAWRSGLHPQDLARSEQELEAALAGGAAFDTRFRVIHPSGEVRHLRAHATVERDLQGKPLRMLGTNVDITDLAVAQQ